MSTKYAYSVRITNACLQISDQTGWFRGNAQDFHSRGAQFESVCLAFILVGLLIY
jgi:hypothetical protein